MAGAVKALAAGTILVCAGYLASAMFIRPSLMPDAAYGLLVHKSMRHGAPWNHIAEPSAENIAADRVYFYAVWSPGQYAVPGALIDAGLSIGRAVATVAILASIVGLAMWWSLYRTLGHDHLSALAAVAVIAASRSFNYSFLAYVGSDVLAFAVFPLVVGPLWKLRHSPWLTPYAAAAMLIAFAAKNSLPIYVGAWITAQTLLTVRAREANGKSLLAAAAPVIAAAATMAAIHWGYNTRGWTPVAYAPVVSTNAATYLLPSAMPILAATSWDDVLSRIFSHPMTPAVAFDYKGSLPLLAAVVAVSVFGVARVLRRGEDSEWTVAAFSIVAVVAFTTLLSTGSGASLDLSRHYRLIGYLWLPLVVAAARSARRSVAITLVVALVIPAAYGLASFASNWRRQYARRASHSDVVQVAHPQMSGRLVHTLTILDRELPDATLVVTPSPDTALEFSRTRVLATSAVSDSINRIRSERRSGSVPNLVVIAELPGMPEDKRQAWLESFTEYAAWESIDVDDHRFYVPAGQVVSAAWLRARFDRAANRS